jgi:predicted DNA-binding transcriptional regulator AlpA
MAETENEHDDVLLDQDSASALLAVSPRTMERWRAERTGPPFVRLSARAIRYSRAALRRWLSERTMPCDG